MTREAASVCGGGAQHAQQEAQGPQRWCPGSLRKFKANTCPASDAHCCTRGCQSPCKVCNHYTTPPPSPSLSLILSGVAGTDLYFSNTSAAPSASSSRDPPPKEMAVAWPTLVKLCVAHPAGPARVDLLDGGGSLRGRGGVAGLCIAHPAGPFTFWMVE